MWLTTMSPESRRLIKVLPTDVQRTAEVFDLLLGDNLQGRKEHIASTALNIWTIWMYLNQGRREQNNKKATKKNPPLPARSWAITSRSSLPVRSSKAPLPIRWKQTTCLTP